MTSELLIAAAAAGPREGFQSIFFAFTVLLGLVAAFNVNHLKIVGACVIAWVVGATIAFATRAQMEGIGEGGGGIISWIFDQF